MDKYIAPNEIRVGFNKREDTFTNMLGFMIYRNKADGNYGYEKSFTGWRDSSIPEKFIGNKFQSGFVINKGKRRFHSYGDSVKVRIYHPEGFEFEIPLDNLALILHNCTLEKATIIEKCIVAWNGSNVYLIPEVISNEVEFKNIDELKEKLSERKFIPASSCQRFHFYNGSEGEEFNLGKIPMYNAIKDNDNYVTLMKDRGAQLSIPASSFLTNPDLKEPIFKGFLGTKKNSEFEPSLEVKKKFNKVKSLMETRLPRDYGFFPIKKDAKYCTLSNVEDRLQGFICNDFSIFNEIEGDLFNSISDIINQKVNTDNNYFIIPKKFKLEEKEYFFLMSSNGELSNTDCLLRQSEEKIFSDKLRNKISNFYTDHKKRVHNANFNRISIHLVNVENFKEANNILNLNEMLKLPELNFLSYVNNRYTRNDKEMENLNIKKYNDEMIEIYLESCNKLT